MHQCGFCGAWFDEMGYQIVAPTLRLWFDSVECAFEALAGYQHVRVAPPPRRRSNHPISVVATP